MLPFLRRSGGQKVGKLRSRIGSSGVSREAALRRIKPGKSCCLVFIFIVAVWLL
jgi:hypothetical protein